MQPQRGSDPRAERAPQRRGGRRQPARIVRLPVRARRPLPAPARMTILQAVRHLGPGVISGVSDLDPTSVATLVIIGSTVGYSLLWLVLLLLPMLMTVQVVSARVGAVAHEGVGRLIHDRFGRWWALAAVLLVLSVNVLTITADLEGGAAALQLLTGVDWRWFILPMAGAVGVVLLFRSYDEVQGVLRIIILVFASYVVAAFLVRPDWASVLYHLVVPGFRWDPHYVAGALALLGTMLTSYVYLWETIEVQEERQPLEYLWLVELDAAVGVVAAVILSVFVVITTAATLGAQGEIAQTAGDAARALVPLAGPFAGIIFAVGLLASALLAVPVLASTTAYLLASTLRWRASLAVPEREARPFYLVLLGSLMLGAALAYVGIEPFQILFLASIAGGIGTPLVLGLLILLARDAQVMGERRIGPRLAAMGWLTLSVVAVAGATYLIQQLL